MKNINKSYKEIRKKIFEEQKKISNPSPDDIDVISKKLNLDKSIVREELGYKDHYDFIDDLND